MDRKGAEGGRGTNRSHRGYREAERGQTPRGSRTETGVGGGVVRDTAGGDRRDRQTRSSWDGEMMHPEMGIQGAGAGDRDRVRQAHDDRDEGAEGRWRWGQRWRRLTGGEVALGLESVTEGEAGPSWGTAKTGNAGWRGPSKEGVGGGGMVSAQDLCMEARTWWGSPPPCPPLGDPLLGPQGGPRGC